MIMKAKIFIGSSSEGKDVAYAIQENLDSDAEITVWDQGVFNLSGNYLMDLLEALDNFDFAILVYTPDDKALIRNQTVVIPRDNIVFETGLFMGKLGKDRVFFLAPNSVKNFHLLSDLSGISYGKYNAKRSDNNLNAALAPFCNQVRKQIKKMKQRSDSSSLTKFKITVKSKPEIINRSVKYLCSCIICNDDNGEEVEKDSEIRWEAGGLTVTLRNIKPSELVQLKIYDESKSCFWESEYFYPQYSTRNVYVKG